jgi:hypothetical protein
MCCRGGEEQAEERVFGAIIEHMTGPDVGEGTLHFPGVDCVGSSHRHAMNL